MQVFKRFLKAFILIFGIFILTSFFYLFVGKGKPAKEIIFGVNFSQKEAQLLGLDWKENYLAILDDLKVKHLRLAAHWDLIEKERDKFDFEDLDWQIAEAEKKCQNHIGYWNENSEKARMPSPRLGKKFAQKRSAKRNFGNG